ncbi:Holliday junction resolvase RuvX [Cerasicoccus maritimus]|uniref:Holliday junction resolvase RuvX n=1 Tax=Cerasicoccus maritimus TaxID=490089 RepID=UPI0028526BC5|nr:Holliday junction resolvase RuvX [Cerasicoccus maritimus]
MNYLGIDYGEKRIGLSAGDDEVCLAVPIPAAVEPTKEARMVHIAQEIKQRRIGALVVGYPYNMDGSVGFKAKEVDAFIGELEAKFGLPIHRTDERLTSQAAEAQMRTNKPKKSRSKKSVKAKQEERRSGNLDSRAAALILQDYLDGGMAPLLPDWDDE